MWRGVTGEPGQGGWWRSITPVLFLLPCPLPIPALGFAGHRTGQQEETLSGPSASSLKVGYNSPAFVEKMELAPRPKGTQLNAAVTERRRPQCCACFKQPESPGSLVCLPRNNAWSTTDGEAQSKQVSGLPPAALVFQSLQSRAQKGLPRPFPGAGLTV